MTTDRNEPAFPFKYEEYKEARPNVVHVYGGLTKREYFAAKAMNNIMIRGYMEGSLFSDVAIHCCKMADALIAELNKEPKNEA